jgi:hypothetical protein
MPDPGKTYDEPLKVDMLGDEIVIVGPGPIGVALTARAAAASIPLLEDAVRRAKLAQLARTADAANADPPGDA